MVPQPFDVVDADNWDFIMALVHAGAVCFLHCGRRAIPSLQLGRWRTTSLVLARATARVVPSGFGEGCHGFLGEFVPPTLLHGLELHMAMATWTTMV